MRLQSTIVSSIGTGDFCKKKKKLCDARLDSYSLTNVTSQIVTKPNQPLHALVQPHQTIKTEKFYLNPNLHNHLEHLRSFKYLKTLDNYPKPLRTFQIV